MIDYAQTIWWSDSEIRRLSFSTRVVESGSFVGAARWLAPPSAMINCEEAALKSASAAPRDISIRVTIRPPASEAV
ncbi:MAG: hypothetical protein P4M15_13795 [Alphaproteobacteria bacterium]|nr:hypothetical protein [Alphaproteobacteria bacterium]